MHYFVSLHVLTCTGNWSCNTRLVPGLVLYTKWKRIAYMSGHTELDSQLNSTRKHSHLTWHGNRIHWNPSQPIIYVYNKIGKVAHTNFQVFCFDNKIWSALKPLKVERRYSRSFILYLHCQRNFQQIVYSHSSHLICWNFGIWHTL